MRTIAPALGAAVLAGCLTGCLTVGSDFPVERVREIRLGVTTRADVERHFGPPWRTGLEDGQPTWTYARYRYALLGGVRTTDLVVQFDQRGIVASYTFNTTDPSFRAEVGR